MKYLNNFGLAYFWNSIKAFFVPQTRKVNNKALISDITLTAADVDAIPLATADSFAKKSDVLRSRQAIIKHYGKIWLDNGDTDKIEIAGAEYQGYARIVVCDIIGVSNIIDPSTGDEVFYGTIHVSCNFKPGKTVDLYEIPLEFRFRFKNEEDKTLLLKESLSQTAVRMMSFQGELKTGGDALDSVLEGVYADFNISNSENSSDKFVSAKVHAVQPIRGDKGYTYWIEVQVPICWTYE